MSPENEAILKKVCPERLQVHTDFDRLTGDLEAVMNAVRDEERARLNGRDDFIVKCGLWYDFVDQLPDSEKAAMPGHENTPDLKWSGVFIVGSNP